MLQRRTLVSMMLLLGVILAIIQPALAVQPPGGQGIGWEDADAVLKSGKGQDALLSPQATALSNEHLTLLLEATGQFTLKTADSRYLLYPSANTSYLSVQVGSSVYTNRDGSLAVETALTVQGPDQALIRYRTPENILVTQRYILRGQAVQLEVQAENPSASSRNVQVRYLLDTQVDENDGSPLYGPGLGVRTYETDVPNPTFGIWRGYDRWPDPTLTALGTLSTPPNRVVFAYWPDAVGNHWAYTTDPNQSITSDSCVLLYFDLGMLPAGRSRSITTYYGTGEPSGGPDRERLISALDQLRQAVKSSIEADLDAFAGLQAKYLVSLRTDWRDYLEAAWAIVSLVTTPAPSDLAKLGKDAEVLGKFAKMAHLVEAGADLGAGLAYLLNQVPTSATEAQIKNDYIKPHFMDEVQIGNRTGVSGLLATVDADYEQYLQQIPNPLPSGYPVDEMVKFMELQIAALNSSRSQETWVMTYHEQMCTMGKLGILQEQEAAMAKLSEALEAADNASFSLTLAEMGVFAGAAILKIAGVVGAPVTAGASTVVLIPTETALWGGAAALASVTSLFGAISTTASLTTKGAMTKQGYEAIAQLANDLASRHAVFTGTGDWLTDGIHLSSRGPQAPTEARAIEVVEVRIPDVTIPSDEVAGRGQGEAVIRNSGSETANVSLYGSVTTEIEDQLPIVGLVGSTPISIPAGGQRTLQFDVTLLRSTLMDRTGYDVHLIVPASNARGAVIEGPFVSHLFAGTREQLDALGQQSFETVARGTLATGGSTERTVSFAAETTEGRVMLSFPEGSDQDLHLYDSSGRHVGRDYTSGEVENEIPGARYSGPDARQEWIAVDQPGTQDLRVQIVNQHSGTGDRFDLSTLESRELPALLDSDTQIGWEAVRTQPGQQIRESFNLRVSEGGGSQDILSLQLTSASFEDGSGNFVPAADISCRVPSELRAGTSVQGTCEVSIQPDIPPGEYRGVIRAAGRDRRDQQHTSETNVSLSITERQAGPTYQYVPLVLKGHRTGPLWQWVTIEAQTFEGVFPGRWEVSDIVPSGGEHYWGKRNCRPFAGSFSAWAVGGGANGVSLPCGSHYPNNAGSWMVLGPFSLASATRAELRFQFWARTEINVDRVFWGASLDGRSFYGQGGSGNTNGWREQVFDLKNVYQLGDLTGRPRVWISISFETSSSGTAPEGVYVDNVHLRQWVPTAMHAYPEPIPVEAIAVPDGPEMAPPGAAGSDFQITEMEWVLDR